jgi:hypothetical protein
MNGSEAGVAKQLATIVEDLVEDLFDGKLPASSWSPA